MGKNIIRGAEARARVVEILKAGGSLEDAARETGFKKNYVRQIGVANGIRFKRQKYGSRQETEATRAEILQLYKKGVAVKEIQNRLGFKSATSVYSTLHKYGISHVKKEKPIVLTEIRFCKECGKPFFVSENKKKAFCSRTCNSADSHKKHDAIRRARKKSVVIDNDITLEKLCERDNNICYLCGGKIDFSDYTIVNGKKCVKGKYPTIDHIKPLVKGGVHSWGNVRLAHFSCNASKGVKLIG